jgi:hypothetical protein
MNTTSANENKDHKNEYSFLCKTNESYSIKILSEIISSVLKTSFYKISSEGIYLKMMDNNQRTMIELDLLACNFLRFQKYNNNDLFIGINSTFLHKLLKSIKKKDTLELILDNKKENLVIQTMSKETQRVSKSSIKVTTVQNMELSGPEHYINSVIIKSTDFQKMIKDLNTIGDPTILFNMENGIVSFSCYATGIMGREISHGEHDDSESKYKKYKCTFRTEDINKISKMCSLGDTIHLYQCTEDKPLILKTTVRNLGTFIVTIKQNELMHNN